MSRNSTSKVNPPLLRRSSSTSLIPTLRRDSRNSRARSISRPTTYQTHLTVESAEMAGSSAKPPRNPSLDRKPKRSSSLSSYQRTPLQGMRSSGLTRSASRSPFKPGSAKKDRPVADKKWVSEQFTKVRDYLMEQGCEEGIVNSLRPPTINMFVYVCNILFKQIDPRIEVNMANYKEVVTTQLKTLDFPGTVSNSLLKTVNTKHAWPQVVNILAWLVDLIVFIHKATRPCSPTKRDILKEEIVDFMAERHSLFNSGNDDSVNDRAFVKRLNGVMDLDEDKLKQLEADMEGLSTLRDQQVLQLEELADKINSAKEAIDSMTSEIEAFNREASLHEEKLDAELVELTNRKEMLVNKTKVITESNVQLRESIAKQPCTFEEKKVVDASIADMKYTKGLKKKKIDSWMQLKDNYDYKLMDLRREVEAKVYEANTELLPLSAQKPELKQLLALREKGFSVGDFEKEIHEVIEKKRVMENEASLELTNLRADVKAEESNIGKLLNMLETLKAEHQHLTDDIQSIEDKSKSLEELKRKVIADASLVKRDYAKTVPELQAGHVPSLKEAELEITQLEAEKLAKTKQFHEHQMETLKSFAIVANTITPHLEAIHQIHLNVANKVYLERAKLLEWDDQMKAIATMVYGKLKEIQFPEKLE